MMSHRLRKLNHTLEAESAKALDLAVDALRAGRAADTQAFLVGVIEGLIRDLEEEDDVTSDAVAEMRERAKDVIDAEKWSVIEEEEEAK